jgi:hypothetical protein
LAIHHFSSLVCGLLNGLFNDLLAHPLRVGEFFISLLDRLASVVLAVSGRF